MTNLGHCPVSRYSYLPINSAELVIYCELCYTASEINAFTGAQRYKIELRKYKEMGLLLSQNRKHTIFAPGVFCSFQHYANSIVS